MRQYRALVDQLYEGLRAPGAALSPLALTSRIISTDEHLHASLALLLEKKQRHERAEKLRKRAEEKQTALLVLATRMQKAEASLASLIDRARESIERADQAASSGRSPTVAQIVAFAERVSYSNAAPCGSSALAIAAKDGFRGGWGTPAPQQHMLALSRFVTMQRRNTAGNVEEEPSAADEPTTKRPRLSAPAFKAKPVVVQPASAAQGNLTLDLNPDEDDDDFE